MTYVLLAIAILITIANFTLILRFKKNKRIAAEKYQELLKNLKDRTIKEMHKQGLHFDRTYPLVSDRDTGYLFCLDTEHKMASFTDPKKVRIIPYTSILASSIQIENPTNDPRYYESVSLIIELPKGEENIVIPLGTKHTKRTSIMGKFILETAEQMNAVIKDIATNASSSEK